MFCSQPISGQLPSHPTAHCATLAELPDGRLLAAWFGGAFETAPDQVILAAELGPGAARWSAPRPIAAMEGRALGQPVFLPRPSGELWLFFDAIMGRDWTSAQPFLQRSYDGGRTWGPAQQLWDYPGLMFRSRPCLLPGRIIIPAYDENTWRSRMMISDDDGRTWRLSAPLAGKQGNIHPCLAALDGGRLLAYLRTGGRGGVIWRSESADGGESWSAPAPTALPNPNSGIDLLRLASGSLLLAYNPSASKRTPLCVALAARGEEFTAQRTLEDGEFEFSYPTLLQSAAGAIQLVYTARRQHIQHATFDEAWLTRSEER